MNPEIINDQQTAKRKCVGGGRAFHSRLEPFVDFIREQRLRRRTWKEIATALADEKNCAITAQGVHQFYRRHLQNRAKGHWEDESNPAESQAARPNVAANRPQSRQSPLPKPSPFARPNIEKINTDQEFT
jgi:hypothetical protein